MKRNRINIRVSDALWERLVLEAAAHGSTMTAIIETALSQYFSPEQTDHRETALLSRMDQYDARQEDIEKELRLCTATLGQYVLYWLIQTEPVPDIEREAAYAIGRRRYDHFIEQVARKLQQDKMKYDTGRSA